MKKYINTAFIYLAAALASGVFYREFTKWNSFTGKTALSLTHLHLFVLGTCLFFLLAVFDHLTDLSRQKNFSRFLRLYHVGLPFMVLMFFVRGVLQVIQTDLSPGASAAISGIAGLSHIIMTAAFLFLFLAFRSSRWLGEQK